jgi:hypothetical protein
MPTATTIPNGQARDARIIVPVDMVEALRAGLYIELGAANEALARTRRPTGHDPDPDRYKHLDATRHGTALLNLVGGEAAIPPARSRWTWTSTAYRSWQDCTASSQRTANCSYATRHATETSGSQSWRIWTRWASSSRPSKCRRRASGELKS